MVFKISQNQRSARDGETTPHSLLSEALGKSLRAVDQKHSGLVHQPPGLVGPPNSGVVPSESEVGGQKCQSGSDSEVRNLCWARAAERPRKLGAGRRHFRHLVLFVALGLRNDGHENAKEILSDERTRNWAGHYFLLGRANDFCRPRI